VRGFRAALTAKQMALQMLCVKVRLRAVRAREFPIGVLRGDHRVLGGAGARRRDGGPARRAGEDATAALGAHDVRRRLEVVEQARVLHHVGLAVGRGHDGLHVLEAVRRHRAQRLGHAALHWRRGDGLRVRHGRRRLGKHRRGRAVLLRRLVVLRRGDHLVASSRAHLGIAVQRIRRAWGVGRGGRARRVRRAVGVHMHTGRLEGRQRLREGLIVMLKLLWRDDREGGEGRVAGAHGVAVILVHYGEEGGSRSEESTSCDEIIRIRGGQRDSSQEGVLLLAVLACLILGDSRSRCRFLAGSASCLVVPALPVRQAGSLFFFPSLQLSDGRGRAFG
jgi:hypothetical protein